MRLELRLRRHSERLLPIAEAVKALVEERRMRDSNPRGVAPNTLSKSVGGCSAVVGTVRDLLKRDRVVFDGRLCTAVNETETETRAVLPPRPSTPHAVGAQIM